MYTILTIWIQYRRYQHSYNNISVMLVLIRPVNDIDNINIHMTIFQLCWFQSIMYTISTISTYIWQYFSYVGLDQSCIRYQRYGYDMDSRYWHTYGCTWWCSFNHRWIRYRRYCNNIESISTIDTSHALMIDIVDSRTPSLKHFILRYDIDNIIHIDTKKAKSKHKRICGYGIDISDMDSWQTLSG